MRYSVPELCALAGRAVSLRERWHGLGVAEQADSLVEERLARWHEALGAERDSGVLDRRLSLDGVDLEHCHSWFGPRRFAADKQLPDWAERFNTLLDRFQPTNISCAALFSEKALPFQEIFAPFVVAATEQLRERAGPLLDLLSPTALLEFQRQLLDAVCNLSAFPAGLEFGLFAGRRNPLSMFSPKPVSAPSRNLYDLFVTEMLAGRLTQFFSEYAVLARLITVRIGYWIDHVAEFCCRLEQDKHQLADVFNDGKDLGRITQVQLGLSDRHNHGRMVISLACAGGTKLIYKPKDLGIDQAYGEFINWLTTRGAPLDLRTPKVLNRSNHGWVEFIDHRACLDAGEAERYYRRIGALLCLSYILGATDYHLENIIASGEHPVVIDLETMLQSLPRPWDATQVGSADQRLAEIWDSSVLRIGLLPVWMTGNPGKRFDMSGIGGEEDQDTGFPLADLKDVNTDEMALQHAAWRTKAEGNRPILDGRAVSASVHLRQIVEGFAETYRFLAARKNQLLAEAGPVEVFRGLKLRYIFRPTTLYGLIAQRLLHPEYLRDGASRSIEMEWLARPFASVSWAPGYPPPWAIYHAELDSLERLDIPFLTFYSNSDDLFADGQLIARHFFVRPGLDMVRSRIERLSEEDLAAQLNLIRASVHARYASHASAVQALIVEERKPSAEPLLSPGELVEAALEIAKQIRFAATYGEDGGVTWFGPSFDSTTDAVRLLPIGDTLYEGRAGVALFFAALEHCTAGAAECRDLAMSALVPLSRILRQPFLPIYGWNSLGATLGLGGQVYSLARIAALLRDPSVMELARRAAHWCTPQRIARDRALDISAGAAGGIPGLFALLDSNSNEEILATAVRCGDRLLETRTLSHSGHRVWQVPWATRPLTGFAHGAAGIAYSLLLLHRETGEVRFREAAEEAIAYETTLYSSRARNWPDLRDAGGDREHAISAWCRGATGIGLARLAALPMLDTPAIREDIEKALQTTLAVPFEAPDHLCCGHAGRIDFLLEAAKQLGRPELLHEARKRGAAIVRRAARSGRYRLNAQAPGLVDSPSFFQGLSGIGYMLLRLAEPERLPCVLRWE